MLEAPKPEWATDPRFNTNSVRVANRITLEGLIEAEARTRTTEEWLQLLDGSGMPYAAVNDIQATMKHEHGISSLFISSSTPGSRYILTFANIICGIRQRDVRPLISVFGT